MHRRRVGKTCIHRPDPQTQAYSVAGQISALGLWLCGKLQDQRTICESLAEFEQNDSQMVISSRCLLNSQVMQMEKEG